MEWIVPFYAQQDEWGGVYSGDVQEHHREKVAIITRMAGPGPLRVLELGAGGGQCAAAASDAGHQVVAVELVDRLAANAQRLAAQRPTGALTVIHGDFYEVALSGPFDVVCYWDGFGVGEDADQRRLLQRIAGWLAPGGCALIDISTPWYWAAAAGQEMRIGNAQRRYDFDAEGCRMLDRWWSLADEAQAVTQSLRCYSPADLRLLLEGTGLRLQALEPGGAVDYVNKKWHPQVPLGQAMAYVAKLG